MKVAALVALAALVICGCSDGGLPPLPTPSATPLPSSTAAPPSTPTPTATARPPSCCEGTNYCRGTGPGAGSSCNPGETAFSFPYECGDTSRCALPTPTRTSTLLVLTPTVTTTPTQTATAATPTYTCTPNSPDCSGQERVCPDPGFCSCYCITRTPTALETPTPSETPTPLPPATPTMTPGALCNPLCRLGEPCRANFGGLIIDGACDERCSCFVEGPTTTPTPSCDGATCTPTPIGTPTVISAEGCAPTCDSRRCGRVPFQCPLTGEFVFGHCIGDVAEGFCGCVPDCAGVP